MYNIYDYAIYISNYILSVIIPILVVSVSNIIVDIYYNSSMYNNIYGGDPILYQHIFWLFGHPEVYILIIPSVTINIVIINMYLCNNII